MSARPLGKSALALLAAGLASLLVWMSLSDPAPADQRPDDTTLKAAPERSTTTRDPTAQLPSSEPAPPRLTHGATPTFVLRAFDRIDTPLRPGTPDRIATGRVAWATTGLPIARCQITVTRWRLDVVGDETDQGDEVKAPDPALVTWSDEFGKFELEGVPDEDELYLRFRLADGSSDVHELRVPVRAGEPTWQGEYLLEERGTIRGRVVNGALGKQGIEVRAVDEFRYDEDAVDEDARAARFAGIEDFAPHGTDRGGLVAPGLQRRDRMLPFPRTHTGLDGSFELRGVRAGLVHLLVAAGHPEARRVPVLVEADRNTDAGEIALRSVSQLDAQSVRVELRNPDGNAARSYQVLLEDLTRRFGNLLGRTDSRGRVSFQVPDDGQDRREWFQRSFRVHARSGPEQGWESVARGSPPQIRARMASRARVEVEFHGIDPALCQQVEVRTTPWSPRATVEVQGGTVTVDRVDPQGTTVVLVVPGHEPVRVGAPGEDLPSNQHVNARPQPTRRAVIRVTDPDGAPWQRARIAVEFQARRADDHAFGPFALGATDDEGRLEVEALWTERMRLHVRHLGVGHYVEPEWTEQHPGNGQIELIVEPAGRIEGEIVDRGAAAGQRFRVRLRRPGQPDWSAHTRTVETTRENTFRFLDVRPGAWRLEVLDPPSAAIAPYGVRPILEHYAEEIVVGPERTTALIVDLGRRRRDDPELVGHVRHGTGRAEGLRIVTVGSEEQVRVLPDDLGRFTIDALPLGATDLALQLRCGTGWATIGQETLPVPDTATGARAEMEFVVPAGAVTAGLFDKQGVPVRERMIDLLREDGTLLSFVTDVSGTLTIPSLPTGNWAVSLHRNQEPDSRSGRHRSSHRFDVEADGHTVLDLHGIR